MKTAIRIRTQDVQNQHGGGVQSIYRLDPPLRGHAMVLVSTITVDGKRDSRIFATADETGLRTQFQQDLAEAPSDVDTGKIGEMELLGLMGYEAIGVSEDEHVGPPKDEEVRAYIDANPLEVLLRSLAMVEWTEPVPESNLGPQ